MGAGRNEGDTDAGVAAQVAGSWSRNSNLSLSSPSFRFLLQFA